MVNLNRPGKFIGHCIILFVVTARYKSKRRSSFQKTFVQTGRSGLIQVFIVLSYSLLITQLTSFSIRLYAVISIPVDSWLFQEGQGV